MKKQYLFILFFWMFCYTSTLSQKVLIDVKTKFSEKLDIHIIKVAVIHTLDTSNWAKTVKVHEDFSL